MNKQLLLFMMALSALSMSLHAQPVHAFIDTPAVLLASPTLETFRKLIDEDIYREMGFDSLSQVQRISTGVPMRIYVVGLQQLRNYQAGTDPFSLLDSGVYIIFPVNVDNRVRSSYILTKHGNVWEATSFGHTSLIKMLVDVRHAVSRSISKPLAHFFVVQIPGFNLYFLSFVANQQLMLVPVLDAAKYGFLKGQTMPAHQVFQILLPHAQVHTGQPG